MTWRLPTFCQKDLLELLSLILFPIHFLTLSLFLEMGEGKRVPPSGASEGRAPTA